MVRALPGGQQLQKGMAESFLRPWVRESFLRPLAEESFLRPWAREASSPEQRSKDNKAMKACSRTDIPLEANKIHPQNSTKKFSERLYKYESDKPRSTKTSIDIVIEI